MEVQVIFADSLHNVIDSLLTDAELVGAGTPDGNGRVNQQTGRKHQRTVISYPKERFAQLQNIRYIYWRASAKTYNFANDQDIRIYSDYEIDIQLGIIVDVEVTSDDFELIN